MKLWPTVLAALIALLALAPFAQAHYSLPGAAKCKAVQLTPASDHTAFDIKAKRITCKAVRRTIAGTFMGGDFRCKSRDQPSGDRQNGIAHTDYSCRNASRQRFIFVIS